MTTVPLEEAKERLEELLAEGEFMVRLNDGRTLQIGVKAAKPARFSVAAKAGSAI